MIEAYPLAWPPNKTRTQRYSRDKSRFKISFARARDELIRQVELLVGRYTRSELIISTNLRLRNDGLPLANQRQPEDTGIAIYFSYKKQSMCFPCDRWEKIEDNMQAIAKTIEALRGIARWGTGDMLQAAFTGFTALPPAQSEEAWWVILQVTRGAPFVDVERNYLKLRSNHHPDHGGSPAAFNEIQKAWEAARKEYDA